MSFKSTRITPGEGKKFKIDGDLTLHGVTKPVTLDAEYVGQLKDRAETSKWGTPPCPKSTAVILA